MVVYCLGMKVMQESKQEMVPMCSIYILLKPARLKGL